MQLNYSELMWVLCSHAEMFLRDTKAAYPDAQSHKDKHLEGIEFRLDRCIRLIKEYQGREPDVEGSA